MLIVVIKIFAIVLITVLLLALLAQLIGFLLPRRVHVTGTKSYLHSSETIQRILQDLHSYPSWKPNVTAINKQQDNWTEYLSPTYSLQYKRTAQTTTDKIVIHTTQNNTPFSLKRNYKLWSHDHMVFVELDDMLEIRRPYLRTLQNLLYSHESVITSELQAIDHYLDSYRTTANQQF